MVFQVGLDLEKRTVDIQMIYSSSAQPRQDPGLEVTLSADSSHLTLPLPYSPFSALLWVLGQEQVSTLLSVYFSLGFCLCVADG